MSSTRTSEGADDDMGDSSVLTHQPDSCHRLRLQSFIDEYGTDPPPIPMAHRIKAQFKKIGEQITWVYLLNAVLDKIPLIRCLKEYNFRSDLFGDLIAGITVAIMHIPQGKRSAAESTMRADLVQEWHTVS